MWQTSFSFSEQQISSMAILIVGTLEARHRLEFLRSDMEEQKEKHAIFFSKSNSFSHSYKKKETS